MEKIGNFRIEARSIFKGRGLHPKSGLVKENIKPEDITLNLSKDSLIPVCPLPGRNWGEIIFNKENAWLASYREKVTNNRKYIQPGASSKIKGLKDIQKFEKARELK